MVENPDAAANQLKPHHPPQKETLEASKKEAAAPPPGISPGEASRDRDLVTRALQGDTAGFEELVIRYQKAVFHIALYKSGNLFDAEDLTQDIFLAAYKALPTLKDLENFAGWLFGIAHNRCHKWFRREHTKIIKLNEIRQQKERESRLVAREDALEETETHRISSEMEQLPHEIKQVLVLKYLEGLSYQVIEARLGIKAYRIDYLIRKGKAILKQKLGRLEAT